MYDYGDCHVCGKRMKERRVKQDFWIRGKLLVIEHVPAGVCPRCGERVVRAEVGQAIFALINGSQRRRKARTMLVPVLRFAQKTA